MRPSRTTLRKENMAFLLSHLCLPFRTETHRVWRPYPVMGWQSQK